MVSVRGGLVERRCSARGRKIYFITTYLDASEDCIRDAEEGHGGDADDKSNEGTGQSHTAQHKDNKRTTS
jgi:hypothetical protein